MMRAFVALLCVGLTMTSVARADIVGPPGDPARRQKIAGIVSADSGLALVVGGVIMLSLQATQNYDSSTKNDLVTAGAVCTAVGGAALIGGAVVWLLARKKTAAWRARQQPSP